MKEPIRLIDAAKAVIKISGKVTPILQKHGSKHKGIYLAVLEALAECPTEDAVEVVRCKECKKWNEIIGTCEGFASNRLPGGGRITFITRETDYCSYGERKDNVQSST